MPEPSLLYWDTAVFLSYLNELPDRITTLEAILDSISKDKQKLIVTSMISKVEVAWVAHEKLNRTLDADEENRIDSLWNDLSVIDFIEFHDDIALIARDIMRTGMIKGWKLRANDAIHLASAQWAQCYEINTYDGKWDKYSDLIGGIEIREPFTESPKLL